MSPYRSIVRKSSIPKTHWFRLAVAIIFRRLHKRLDHRVERRDYIRRLNLTWKEAEACRTWLKQIKRRGRCIPIPAPPAILNDVLTRQIC